MLRKLSLFVVSACYSQRVKPNHNPSQNQAWPNRRDANLQIPSRGLYHAVRSGVVTIAQGVRYKPMATRAAPALVPKYTALRRANAMAAPVNNL